jgi:hypothetical protein
MCVHITLEVRVHYVVVFVVDICVLHHHDDGGEGVVDATKDSESLRMLFTEDAVGLCVFRACVFD